MFFRKSCINYYIPYRIIYLYYLKNQFDINMKQISPQEAKKADPSSLFSVILPHCAALTQLDTERLLENKNKQESNASKISQPQGQIKNQELQNYFKKSHGGRSNGFGQQLVNSNSQQFKQVNKPTLKQFNWHSKVAIANSLLVAVVLIRYYDFQPFQIDLSNNYVFMLAYFIYLAMSYYCSQIKQNLRTISRLSYYQKIFDIMKKQKGFFRFQINCFHYSTYNSPKGAITKKTQTFYAEQIYNFADCIDKSGEIGEFRVTNVYGIANYSKKFTFKDEISKKKVVQAFNKFVMKNKKDTHQQYRCTFVINNFQDHLCYTTDKISPYQLYIFHISTILGFAFPYALMFQSLTTRYNINIHKILI